MTQRSPALTPTQHRAVALAARGLSNKTIAEIAGISEASVKTHLFKAFRKLGVESRTQLSLLVMRGLVREEELVP